MWVCSKCGENLEEQFDTCWRCGFQRDGKTASSQRIISQRHDEIEAGTSAYCRFCGKQIGSADPFCRRCGRSQGSSPAVAATIAGSSSVSVTVTNPKQGKDIQIVGAMIAVFGLVVLMISCGASYATDTSSGSGTGMAVGLLLLVGGIIVNAVGKFQHWYHAE